MASQALLTSLQQWACVLVLLTSIGAAAAQDCYYPNGDLSPNDSPCSSEVQGACCPLNWECLSNGLCYLESEDYYERHTCTDQSWSDSNCPNLCTYNGTAAGNEAILLCDLDDEGSWCCNANRVSFDCCTKSEATTFSAAFGTPVAKISSEPGRKTSVSAKTTSSSSSEDDPTSTTSSPSSTSETSKSTPSSTSTSSTSRPPSSTSTAVLTTITSNSDGQISTLISTTVVITAGSAASPTSSPTSDTPHKRKLPVILGVSIGVPLGLIAAAILFYIFSRYQRYKASTTPTAPNTNVFFPSDATNLPTTYYEKAELDSHPTSVAEKPPQQQAHNAASELEATSHLSPNQPSSSVSPLTVNQEARWSAVSSLSPRSDRNTSLSIGTPTALGLQAISQQLYGTGQSYLYRPVSAPEGASIGETHYRPYRPPVEPQHAAELAGSEVPAGEGSDHAGGKGEVQDGQQGDKSSNADG